MAGARLVGCLLAFTILWPLAAIAPGAPAVAADEPAGVVVPRPNPSLQRELDRLDREGEVDPLTRRRLEDRLRQQPFPADRRQGERTLRRLPTEDTAPGPPSASSRPALPPADLPSSLPGEGSRR